MSLKVAVLYSSSSPWLLLFLAAELLKIFENQAIYIHSASSLWGLAFAMTSSL